MRRILIPPMAVLFLIVTACNTSEEITKSDSGSSPALSSENFITADWQITNHTIEPVETLVDELSEQIDLYANYDECQKNEILHIEAGGRYEIEQVEANCGPEAEIGTWRYNSEKTGIVFKDGPEGKFFTIEGLDDETLRIRSNVSIKGRAYYNRQTYMRL